MQARYPERENLILRLKTDQCLTIRYNTILLLVLVHGLLHHEKHKPRMEKWNGGIQIPFNVVKVTLSFHTI